MLKDKFVIALEGIDGSGKTTQCILLRDYLAARGIKARITGRRFIASTIKGLFSGSEIIIADRYSHTIRTYLRHKKGKRIKSKLILCFLAILPKPKLLFFLDIDVESALARLAERGRKSDKYETLEWLEIFAEGYELEFMNEGCEAHRLNALDAVEHLHNQIARIADVAVARASIVW